MALFESYERRIDKINSVLNSYGIASLEEAEKITKDAGLDVYNQIKGIQPICFENACWAYITGAAIAIKKGCTRAADAAAAIGEGLPIGAGLEDLGKGLRSQVGTMYGTLAKGPRYLEMAEGYVTGIALDDHDEIIGYQFVSLGKFTDFVKAGDTPNEAWEKAKGQYGRVADAVKIIDPRKN